MNNEIKGKENKKELYTMFLDMVDFFPSYKDISDYLEIPEEDVYNDLKNYGLLYKYNKLENLIERLNNVKPIYEEYRNNCRLSILTQVLKCSAGEVNIDINELNNRFNMGLIIKRETDSKREIKTFEKVVKESNKVCTLEESSLKELSPYKLNMKKEYAEYFDSYETLDVFIIIDKIAKSMGKEPSEVLSNLKSLKFADKFSYLFGESAFVKRFSFYLPYIYNNYCICTKLELSQFLNIPYKVVLNDINIMEKNNGFIFETDGEVQIEFMKGFLGLRVLANGNIVDIETDNIIYECIPYIDKPFNFIKEFTSNETASSTSVDLYKYSEKADNENFVDEKTDLLPEILDSDLKTHSVKSDKIDEIESFVIEENIENYILTENRKRQLDKHLLDCKDLIKKKREKLGGRINEFLDRAYLYKKIIEKLGYIPYINLVSKYTGISNDIIVEDFEKLNYTPMTNESYNNDIINREVKEKALKNKELFEQYYYNAESPLSINELGMKLKLCEASVINQMRYLEEYEGLSIKSISEISEEEIVDEKEIRVKYYIENYFNNDLEKVKSFKEMSKELNISIDEVSKEIYELELEIGIVDSNIDNLILNAKDNKVVVDTKDDEMLIEIDNDSLDRIDENTSEVVSEVVTVPISNNSLRQEDRLKIYAEYFEKNASVDSIPVLADKLGMSNAVIMQDFVTNDLFEKYIIDNVNG